MNNPNSILIVVSMLDSLFILVTLEMYKDFNFKYFDPRSIKQSIIKQLVKSYEKQILKFDIIDLLNLTAFLHVINERNIHNPLLAKLVCNIETQIACNMTKEQLQDAMDQCLLRDLLNSAGI